MQMEPSERHKEKASAPITFKCEPAIKVTLERRQQSLKHSSPRVLTDEGTQNDVRERFGTSFAWIILKRISLVGSRRISLVGSRNCWLES
jgi:hypothetical protein